MEHIETKSTRTNSFQMPAKFGNYRRITLIMKIDNLPNENIFIKLKDGQSFQELGVSTATSNWKRSNTEKFSFGTDKDIPVRFLLEITPYKYSNSVKTELKMLHDNKGTAAGSPIQIAHLTFYENVDNIIIETDNNANFDVAYTAYGELE